MHEFSLMQELMKIIEAEAFANDLLRVDTVTLQIGRLRQVVPDFMSFAFATITKDTIAANAELIIEEIPLKIRCSACAEEFLLEDQVFICPNCGNQRIEVVTGKEVVVKYITGEQRGEQKCR